MKKVFIIDDASTGDGKLFDMYGPAFKHRAPQVEVSLTSPYDPDDAINMARTIKPDLIIISLDQDVDSAMNVIRGIRQIPDLKSVKMAAFVNKMARDYSQDELRMLGITDLWDKVEDMSGAVVKKSLALLGVESSR